MERKICLEDMATDEEQEYSESVVALAKKQIFLEDMVTDEQHKCLKSAAVAYQREKCSEGTSIGEQEKHSRVCWLTKRKKIL